MILESILKASFITWGFITSSGLPLTNTLPAFNAYRLMSLAVGRRYNKPVVAYTAQVYKAILRTKTPCFERRCNTKRSHPAPFYFLKIIVAVLVSCSHIISVPSCKPRAFTMFEIERNILSLLISGSASASNATPFT